MASSFDSSGAINLNRKNTQGVDPKSATHGVKTEFLKTPIEGNIPYFPGD